MIAQLAGRQPNGVFADIIIVNIQAIEFYVHQKCTFEISNKSMFAVYISEFDHVLELIRHSKTQLTLQYYCTNHNGINWYNARRSFVNQLSGV